MFKDAFAEAWGFSEHDVLTDEGFEDLVFEEFGDAVFALAVKVDVVTIFTSSDNSDKLCILVLLNHFVLLKWCPSSSSKDTKT